MDYTITISDQRLVAGIAKQTARFNAGQAEGYTLTEAQFLAAMLDSQINEWANELAPAAIPLGQFLARWTPEEQAGAFTLGGQSEEMRTLWLTLLQAEPVHLDDARLIAGVPQVCAALEQMGVIAPGRAAARAAAIMAF